MKKPLALLAVAAIATFASFADTTATYTTGDTSLADGKVTIAYDGSDKITSLSLNPTSGETLTLTGDTLPFAANAVISPGGQTGDAPGVVVVSNAFAAAGALKFTGMTNMTYQVADFATEYIDATGVTLFEDVRLADIAPVCSHGKVGTAPFTTPSDSNKYLPYNITRVDAGTMTFECQRTHDNGLRRSVFFELVQDGDNIVVKVLGSCYRYNDAANLGEPAFTYENHAATPKTGMTNDDNGYQLQKMLTIGPRSGSGSKLTFAVSDDLTLKAVSGGGVEVTFERGEASISENQTWTAESYGLKHTMFETLFENVSIDDIVPVAATGSSYMANGDAPVVISVVRGEDGGEKWLKFEIQSKGKNIIRGMYISLKQNGANVVGMVLALRNYAEANMSYYGQPLFTSASGATGYGTTSTPASNYGRYYAPDGDTSGGLGLASLVVGPRTFTVKASGANTMTNSTCSAFVIRSAGCPIVYDVAAKYALPATIDCYGNATLNFSVAGAYNNGANFGTDAITMHDGTTLKMSAAYPFHYASGEVILDGATLTNLNTTKDVYLNYMTLKNGATVDATSRFLRSGYAAENPTWTVTGTGLSTYTGNLQLLAKNGSSSGANDLTVYVDDTVAGDGTDFLLTGDITEEDNHKYAGLMKRGEGTMEICGTLYTTNRATCVYAGTLLLTKSGATMEDTQIRLYGGTLRLAANTHNVAKYLGIHQKGVTSTLHLEEGATLELTTLQLYTYEGADPAYLAITAADGAKVKVNGTLDAATLSRIRLNGRRVMQSADGYLGIPGFMLIFR